jgi:hypothetical protein
MNDIVIKDIVEINIYSLITIYNQINTFTNT